MALDRFLTAASRDLRRPLPELGDELDHPLAARGENVGIPLYPGREDRHEASLAVRSDLQGLDLFRPPSALKVGAHMFVRLSDPALAEDFLEFLRRADCIADLGEVEMHAEGIALEVGVPEAYSEAQARLEVALYLRVWEAVHPGSGAEILEA